ncbi:4052_t:CDS:2 [Ambispora gerdemannii]|uniref:4052_t:CDS:1 n=1 Tax=Ambispora gerdemannii TaxID=144530 RepID=A0A9N8ZU04_9GLOM|nr:4052_t:CDS:2 [Ambispora gerdemannii]
MNHMNEYEMLEFVDFTLQYKIDHPESNVREITQKYNESKQANGTGKSKLLRELAVEKDVFVVYIYLRDSITMGYPKRSTIADIIAEKSFSKAHYFIFLLALFGMCSEFLDQQLRENAKKTCDRVMEQMKLQEISTDVVEKIANHYKNLMVTLKKLSNTSPFKMLVFDEAGALIDSNNTFNDKGDFYHLRKALQAISRESFMALFTDTLKSFKFLFWKMPRLIQQTDIDEATVIEFVMEKILCDMTKARYIYEKRVNSYTFIETVTEALVILGPRLYLKISSLLQQASKLVSNHMRILRHVDDERELLITISPSEFMLAEAASHTMNCPGIFESPS